MRAESTSVTFNANLSAMLQEFDAAKAASRFIGRRVAPIYRSASVEGQFPIFNRESFSKRTDDNRAPDGSFNRIITEIGRGTFTCEDHGLESRIDNRKIKQYSSLFDAQAAVSRALWYQLLLNHEYRVEALIDAVSWTNHNVGTAWSTSSSAAPIDDIQTGIDTIGDNCGAGPEDIIMVIPRADYTELVATTQISNKIQYTYPGIQPAQLQAAQLASMFGLKGVAIGRSSVDATEQGYAASLGVIWTAGVIYLLVCADEDDDLGVPSAARTVLYTDNTPNFPEVYDYVEERTDGTIVRVRMDTDEIALSDANVFGYKLTNT